MSNQQTLDFQSRVDRIIHTHYKPRPVIKRDSQGAIIIEQPYREKFSLFRMLRSLLLLYISFTVFKAVLIENSNGNEYANIIATLEAGDSQDKIVAYTMTPGYFTKPVGVFVADVANRIKEAQDK